MENINYENILDFLMNILENKEDLFIKNVYKINKPIFNKDLEELTFRILIRKHEYYTKDGLKIIIEHISNKYLYELKKIIKERWHENFLCNLYFKNIETYFNPITLTEDIYIRFYIEELNE